MPDLVRLARRHGTPLFVHDLARVRANAERLRTALPEDVWIAYAVKANPHQQVIEALEPFVDALDVSSHPELENAVGLGWSGARITFSGPAKKDDAIHRAAEIGARITAEATDQHERIRRVAPHARTAVRVNPKVRVNAYRVPMGGVPSAFGVMEDELDGIVPFTGLQLFAGSEVSSVGGVMTAVCMALDIAERYETIDWVSFGGGLTPGFDVETLGRKLGAALGKFPRKLSSGFEVGRFLVQDAGWYVAEVVSTKTSHGERFVVLDGGFNHIMLGMGRFGPQRQVRNLTNPDAPVESVHVVGPLCTPLDRFEDPIALAAPRVGDLLVVEGMGAYGLTASPDEFIGHELPMELVLGA